MRTATWPRWMDADTETATSEPAEATGAARRPEEPAAPDHAQVEAPAQPSAAEPSQAARKAPEPDDVPLGWMRPTKKPIRTGPARDRRDLPSLLSCRSACWRLPLPLPGGRIAAQPRFRSPRPLPHQRLRPRRTSRSWSAAAPRPRRRRCRSRSRSRHSSGPAGPFQWRCLPSPRGSRPLSPPASCNADRRRSISRLRSESWCGGPRCRS